MTTRTLPALPAALILILALAAGPRAATAAAHPAVSKHERKVIRIINSVRAEHGLGRVSAGRALNRAADHHSADMVAGGFLAHDSSDGSSFSARVRRFASFPNLGEILATVSPGAGAAQRAVDLWMGSAPHRAILLTAGYTRIGLAAREGTHGGHRMTYYTADFGG